MLDDGSQGDSSVVIRSNTFSIYVFSPCKQSSNSLTYIH